MKKQTRCLGDIPLQANIVRQAWGHIFTALRSFSVSMRTNFPAKTHGTRPPVLRLISGVSRPAWDGTEKIFSRV